MEVLMAKLSILLKEARLEKGYSEEELGNMLGVSNVSISHWEGGRRIPQDKQLRRLALILDLNLDELIDLAELDRCTNDMNKLKARYKKNYKEVLLGALQKEMNEN